MLVVATLLLAATVAAGPSVAARSPGAIVATNGPAALKLPLPAPNQVSVTLVTLKVTAPAGQHAVAPKVAATNAAALGGATLNTQLVAAVSPKSARTRTATFRIWIFIHRFPAVVRHRGAAKATAHGAAGDPDADISLGGRATRNVMLAVMLTHCSRMKDDGWFSDNDSSVVFDNGVPTNDTEVEAQIDFAVERACHGWAGVEPIDSGSR